MRARPAWPLCAWLLGCAASTRPDDRQIARDATMDVREVTADLPAPVDALAFIADEGAEVGIEDAAVDAGSEAARACARAPAVAVWETIRLPTPPPGPFIEACRQNASQMVWARVLVAPGTGFRVEGTNVRAAVVEDCASMRCLGDWGYANTAGAPREVFVALLGRWPFTTDPTLEARLVGFSIAAQSRCETAPLVAPGGAWSVSRDTAVIPAPWCPSHPWRPGTAVNYVRVEVPPRHALVVAPGLGLWTDCDSQSCTGLSEYRGREYAVFNTGPRTMSRVVGMVEGDGRSLRLDSFDPRAICATATEATPDGSVPDIADGPAYEIRGCGDGHPRRWVRVALPAMSRLQVRGSAAVFEGCVSCAYADATGTWFNRGPAARDLRVGFAAGQRAEDVAAQVRPVDPALRCEGAPRLSPEAPLRDLSFTERGEPLDACERTSASVRFARVEVPAGQRLVVTAGRAELSLVDDCTARRCVATATGVLVWENTTGALARRVVAMSAPAALPEVTARFEVPAPGGRCEAPTPLRGGDQVTVVGADARGELSVCTSLFRWHYYEVEVPAGMRLAARAYLPGMRAYPVQTRILGGCNPLGCPEWRELEPTIHRNEGGAAQRVLVAVPAVAPYLTLETRLEASATNGVCAMATRVTAGTVLREQRSLDAVERLPPGCGWQQPALFYAIRVGARRRLVVSSGMPSSLRMVALRDGCAGACLAAERSVRGDVAVTTWTNGSDEAREVIVAFIGSGGVPGSTADLGFDEESAP